jgi:hypothetical protein
MNKTPMYADILYGGDTMGLLETPDEKHKVAIELFSGAIQAAPDSLIKGLTGSEFGKQIVDGAKLIEDYLYGLDK